MRPASVLFLPVLCAAAACASPSRLDRAALPDVPVLFVYRSEDEANRRAELLQRAREGRPAQRAGEARARLEEVAELFGMGPSEEERRAELLGRLSQIDPRSQEVEAQPFAVKGARPLDWSPDRSRLLYAMPRNGTLQIFEYDRASGDLRAITRGPATHSSGCYGPDGRIAYTEYLVGPQGSMSRIVMLDPRDGRPRAVTRGPADSGPAWSPDGEVLLYVTESSSERARIVAWRPDGSGPRVIARGRMPVFTPDGQWVVYSARTPQGWRLRRMRPDGGGKLHMGRSPHDEHWPSVSPDGRYVAYVAEVGLRQQLRVRTLDGSSDRPLLERGDGAHPVWN